GRASPAPRSPALHRPSSHATAARSVISAQGDRPGTVTARFTCSTRRGRAAGTAAIPMTDSHCASMRHLPTCDARMLRGREEPGGVVGAVRAVGVRFGLLGESEHPLGPAESDRGGPEARAAPVILVAYAIPHVASSRGHSDVHAALGG